MKYKAYIITFDKSWLDSQDYTKFHNLLTGAKDLVNWWHHLESSYIIIVDNRANATTISSFVSKVMVNKKFLVCQLNLKDHNGWLPQAAWDWINEQNQYL